MRSALIGLTLAVGLAGSAHAGDFIVVASTEPGVARGQEVEGGARLPVGAGRTVTLMHASGDVTVLRGSATGAAVPRRSPAPSGEQRMANLKVLVNPPPTGSTFGARRSGVCPLAESLNTLDAILAAQNAGCASVARQALDAYVAANGDPS